MRRGLEGGHPLGVSGWKANNLNALPSDGHAIRIKTYVRRIYKRARMFLWGQT